MGFVSFLKKVGKGIIKYVPVALKDVGAIEPVAEALVPASIPFFAVFNLVASRAMLIEQDFEAAFSGQKTGPQKLLALSAYVGDILKQTNLAVNHKIADPDLAQKAAQGFAQSVVDFMQSLEGAPDKQVVAG